MNNLGDELLTEEEAEAPEKEELKKPKAPAKPKALVAVVTAKLARVYKTPSRHADSVATLHRGDEVPITGVAGGNVWVQIGPDQWVPFQFKGKQHLVMKD